MINKLACDYCGQHIEYEVEGWGNTKIFTCPTCKHDINIIKNPPIVTKSNYNTNKPQSNFNFLKLFDFENDKIKTLRKNTNYPITRAFINVGYFLYLLSFIVCLALGIFFTLTTSIVYGILLIIPFILVFLVGNIVLTVFKEIYSVIFDIADSLINKEK